MNFELIELLPNDLMVWMQEYLQK